MSALDPYYLVKDEIEESVNEIDENMGKWGQLPQVSNERATLTKNLMSTCDTIKWQLDEIDKAIGVAERDPSRFSVNSAEIQHRRVWTNGARSKVSNFRKTLQLSDDTLRIPHAAPMMPYVKNQIPEAPPPTNRFHGENEEYIRGEQERQTQLIKEQDEDLDELSHSVDRMGEVGLAIHDELGSQEELLLDVGREVETVSARLDHVQKKMELLIKKAGAKGQILMIVFLVVLLAILVMLISYT